LSADSVWLALESIKTHQYAALRVSTADPACAIVLLTAIATGHHSLLFIELTLTGPPWPDVRLETVARACTTLAYAPHTTTKFMLQLDFETDDSINIPDSEIYSTLATALAATHIHAVVFEDVRSNIITSARMPPEIAWTTFAPKT
jgi:hypothetical protein